MTKDRIPPLPSPASLSVPQIVLRTRLGPRDSLEPLVPPGGRVDDGFDESEDVLELEEGQELLIRFGRKDKWIPIRGGDSPAANTGVVMEAVRAPVDREAVPNPFASDKNGLPFGGAWHPCFDKSDDNFQWSRGDANVDNSTAMSAALSMGTVAIDGKTYQPIPAVYFGGEPLLDENGEPVLEPNPDYTPENGEPEQRPKRRKRGEAKTDDDGNPLYLLARTPETTVDDIVIRQVPAGESPRGDFPVRYKYGPDDDDGDDGDGDDDDGGDDGAAATEAFLFPFLLDGVPARYFTESGVVDWPTTADPELAQKNYVPAFCPMLDPSELLVEGERVEFVQKSVKLKIPKLDEYGEPVPVEDPDEGTDAGKVEMKEITFSYCELTPPESYRAQLHGSGEVLLYSARITRDTDFPTETPGPGDTFELTAIDDLETEIDARCERVFLALQENHARAKLVNAVGICNDCSQPRLRGVFYKEDDQGRKYPVAFEVDYLPYRYAVETAEITCYYHTNTDDCNPVWNRPLYTIGREDDWHLRLLPSQCAIPCTALTPTQGVTPPPE